MIALLFNLTVEPKITSVVVYPDRALITRSASLELSGETEVVIPNLTGFLDERSVRIRGEGLIIGEVKVRRGYVEKPAPDIVELERQIKELEEKIKEKDNEQEILKAKGDFLNSIKLGTPEIIAKELREGKISPSAWRDALNFLGTEYSQLKSSLQKVEREKEELNKKLTALKKELQDKRALVENKKEITFRVAAQKTERCKIEIEYLVLGEVFWLPIYEIYSALAENSASLFFYARVWQRTGEDWEGVNMNISTIRPEQYVGLPETYPWYVDLIEEIPLAHPGNFQMEKGAVMPEPLLSGTEATEAVKRIETGISLHYSLPGKVNLKSGEVAKRFLISSVKLPLRYEFFSFPKLVEKVFMKGRLFNNTESVFLGGETDTYIGSEYTGRITIPDWTPEETLDINFGTDERVKIKREPVKIFTAKVGGLFGKREKKEFLYRLTLENHRPTNIKFSILDQYPISRHSDIVVKVNRIYPKEFEEDKEQGTITWKGELAPGKKQTFELGFSVEYPRGKRISGL